MVIKLGSWLISELIKKGLERNSIPARQKPAYSQRDHIWIEAFKKCQPVSN